MADKVQATISFRAGRVFVPAGTWFDPDDPVVRNYPTLFTTTAADTPVRTTATVSGQVAAPPPTMQPDTPVRPPETASKALWVRYVTELGGESDGLTKTELVALAADLEGL